LLVVVQQVTTADSVSGVLIEDLLPGGLEAVDPAITGNSGGGNDNGMMTDFGGGGGWGKRSGRRGGGVASHGGGPSWWWWRPQFTQQVRLLLFALPLEFAGMEITDSLSLLLALPQVYKDRVKFFVQWMRPGTHTFSYRTTAVTQGLWTVPPAEVRRLLELFGPPVASRYLRLPCLLMAGARGVAARAHGPLARGKALR
jgi:hypothetical protein